MQEKPIKAKLARKPPRSPLAAAAGMYRVAVGKRGLAHVPRLAYEFLLRSPAGQRVCMRLASGRKQMQEYTVELPPGLPAHRLTMRIEIPKLPPSPFYEFTEHPVDAE